jgi:hypothetical protein
MSCLQLARAKVWAFFYINTCKDISMGSSHENI